MGILFGIHDGKQFDFVLHDDFLFREIYMCSGL